MDEYQEGMNQNMEQTEGSETESGTKGRRTKRSKEELIAAIDAKIAAENDRHVKMISKLEEAKKNILKPRLTKKDKVKLLVEEAAKQNSPEKVAEMLGLDAADLFS